MTFSEKKINVLKANKELKTSTFLIALLTAAALFVPYIILGHGYFIFYGDFNVQQIPFYKMCHAAIKSGAVRWSFTTDLGSNFIGSYAFYLLGSPFFWLTIPFSNSFVPHLMGPLLILKFACAALTAYLYVRRFTRTPEAARLGGLLYAFSGFSIYNIFFNHFHEAIIVFPLLLLALEYLITENRRGVFALAVCLAAITNYFFFFGMAVFCVIYYIVRLTTGDIKFKFSRFLALCFEAVLGVLMAAALLLPALLAILGNERVSNILLGWGGIMYGREQIYLNIIECFFFPPDLPARPVFFPEAGVKWASLGGWLPLFGMTGVISWFSAKKKTWQRRLLIVCIFMALVPILNSAFYAFNSSYYARWFYMPILIMCLTTVRVFEDDVDFAPGFRWGAGITAGLTLVIGLFPRRNDEGKIIIGLFTDSDTMTYKFRFWATAAIAVGSLIVLKILASIFRKNKQRFIAAATALVCVIAAVYGNFFIALGRMHSYDIKPVMIDELIEGKVDLEGDKDTFRIDTYHGVDNTGMFLGYSTINAFHSVVPSSIMDFYKYVGVQRDVGSRPGTDNPALRPLLAVKYLLDRTDDEDYFKNENNNTEMAGYKYVKTEGGYDIYQNENYIGYGFSADYYMTKGFLDTYDGPQRARMMLKGVLLDGKQIEKYKDFLTDISDVRLQRQEELYNAQFFGEQQETLYDEEESGQDILDEETQTPEKAEAESIPEDKISLDLTDEEMARDAARLAATAATTFKTDNSGFTAVVNRDKKALVVFSIPYDNGWTATVNGKAVEIEKVNMGLMAVAVEEGQSTIRFDYKTPGLYTGVLITGAAFVIFLLYFTVSRLIISKRKAEEVYPEGDRLLKEWKTDEVSQEFADEEEANEPPKKSLLDGLDKIESRNYTREDIQGGFKVDKDLFKED